MKQQIERIKSLADEILDIEREKGKTHICPVCSWTGTVVNCYEKEYCPKCLNVVELL